jgi:hypothetical protein
VLALVLVTVLLDVAVELFDTVLVVTLPSSSTVSPGQPANHPTTTRGAT